MRLKLFRGKVARKLALSYILIICLPLLVFSILWYGESRQNALTRTELMIENNLNTITWTRNCKKEWSF